MGTLPGDTSIEERTFYEDNRNSFWKLMYEILPLQNGEWFASRKSTSRHEELHYGIDLQEPLEIEVKTGKS